MWKALAGIPEDAWRDAIDMENAQVAVSPYKPADWPEDTVLLIRRVKLDPGQVSADPRFRRRRTCWPRKACNPAREIRSSLSSTRPKRTCRGSRSLDTRSSPPSSRYVAMSAAEIRKLPVR